MQDEASEGTETLYELMPSLLREPAVSLDDGSPFIGNIYLTSNPVPGQNYLKRHFLDPRTRKRDGRHNFIQSLPDNNPLLPEGYIDKAFATMNPTLLKMLRYGDWDVDASEFQIVPIDAFMTIDWELVEKTEPVAAGIDVGLGRPDASTLYLADSNGHTWRELTVEEYDTMAQFEVFAPYCAEVARNNGEVWIDASSVGKGLADRLTQTFGDHVIRAVGFGDGPMREDHEERVPYANLRAQLYFWARNDVTAAATIASAGERPQLTIESNEQLVEEFENTYYMPKDGKLIIEPKDNIKERIGRSPDDADGFVLCNAARRSVASRPPALPVDRTNRRSRHSLITSGY
jgi:class 3 adenylate cyclase